MDESRINSKIGSRNRESFRIDNVPMALIHRYSEYTLIYTSRHLSTNINEIIKIFADSVFLQPRIVINPAFIKNNKDTYYAKITFDVSVSIDQIKEALYSYRTNSVSNINDINTPIKPKNIISGDNGIIRYICGRCETSFIKAQRCPECGQLVKE